MKSDMVFFIYCAVMIVLCIGASYCLFYKSYHDRVVSSKAISQFQDMVIPLEISTLIGRFDPSVEVRIADKANISPQAAIFYHHPAYIIISRNVLGQANDDTARFESKHLLALVAHELGHIVLASKSTWLLELCVSGMVGTFLFLILTVAKFNWIGSLCSLLGFVIITNAFTAVSRADEYRADAFAVKDALIPITDLAEALITLKHLVDQRRNTSVGRSELIKKALIGILGSTHPSVEQRIRRLQTFYGE